MKRSTITPRLLSAHELSEYIGLPRSTIYEWAAQQRLPCVRLGRLLRFDLHEIEQWIETRKTMPKAPAATPPPSARKPAPRKRVRRRKNFVRR